MKIEITPKALEHFQQKNITTISVLFPGCGNETVPPDRLLSDWSNPKI